MASCRRLWQLYVIRGSGARGHNPPQSHLGTSPVCMTLLVCLQGLIHVSELLAPSHLVAGDVEEEEGEQYTEVEDIDPAAYYKVQHHKWQLGA